MEFKDRFKDVWKDPVWSKVISAAIIALAAGTWKYIDKYSFLEFVSWLIFGLTLNVPLYWIFIPPLLYTLYYFLMFTRRKRNREVLQVPKALTIADPLWNELIGRYSFRQLSEILIAEKVLVGNSNVALELQNAYHFFDVNFYELVNGINMPDKIRDRNQTIFQIIPKLVELGLVEIQNHKEGASASTVNSLYKITSDGIAFHDLIVRAKDKVQGMAVFRG